MPHMFPSGQFPPGACGQVRPVGATLPTATAAGPFVKPRTATPIRRPGQQSHRETRHSRTAESCHRDRPQRHLRGQVQKLDLPGRSDAGHIRQPQKTRMSWTAFPRTPANTKKSLRTISRLKTLSKHGGFLLSHLVWQYHRR